MIDNKNCMENTTDSEYLDRVISLAKRCGCLVLETGGETYRAEETVLCICHSYGMTDVSVIAMTTGMMMSCRYRGLNASVIGRVTSRRQDFLLLDRINEISHRIAAGKLDVEEATAVLDGYAEEKPLPFPVLLFATSVCTAAFCGLFGGGIAEIPVAFLAGLVLHTGNVLFRPFRSHSYFMCIIGGILVALCAAVAGLAVPSLRISAVIIGGIMPLVPGVALTNSLRDLFTGDLISGITRLAEALLIAVCIAAGTGVVLYLFRLAGGVIL